MPTAAIGKKVETESVVILKDKAIQCSRCILDTHDDPKMTFDENGVCHYCRGFEKARKQQLKEGKEGERLMGDTIDRIKSYGKDRKYDCLIGLSGGMDSSYVAYIAQQHGLRALCVHFDNGWDSETAISNIQQVVTRLEYDLYTYVIDWEEFKDLQLAYLKASVIDIEVITDHAIYGTIYKIAKERGIKYILGGLNMATESILPFHWCHKISDYINIKAIHKKYGTRKLRTFPFVDRKMRSFIANSGIEVINYLDWLPYRREEVKTILQTKLGWKDYGGKHWESIFTHFFQVYILPKKFGVDKRKAHFSNLICSGQMTKEEALKEMKQPLYDEAAMQIEKEFVLKKLGITPAEFEKIMKTPIRSHWDFDYEGSLFHYYPILRPLRPLWNEIKKYRKD